MDMNSDAKPHYHWVEIDVKTGEFPRDAFRVGRERTGEDIYLGRVNYGNSLLPAKVIPVNRVAYTSFRNREIVINRCQVLVMRTYFDWRWAKDGHVPDNAFQVGSAGNGEALYVGRVAHEGTITPGKIQPSHGCCYYPFNGEELSATEYECLIHRQVCCE